MATREKNFMNEQAELDTYTIFRESAGDALREMAERAKEASLAIRLAAITPDIHVFVASLKAAAIAAQRIDVDCQALAARGDTFRGSRTKTRAESDA